MRTLASLQWLEQSIQATDYNGSAAYYHVFKGWSPAYPETTGYIIETLFDYAEYLKEDKWKNLAFNCADWLCSIQRADGALPGGMGVDGEPVVFDTGQILFGLYRAYKESGDHKYLQSAKKAVEWLINNLNKDGNWQHYAYISNYEPTYYTRVVWGILATNQILNIENINHLMQSVLKRYAESITVQNSFIHWGFAPQEMAYTHTIAYTIRGFLECGYLLNDPYFIKIAEHIIIQIIQLYESKGKLAGRYDEKWNGDYSFECVTGNAQLAIVMARLFQLTNNHIYKQFAVRIFQDTFSKQWLIPLQGLYGAISGSHPLWGAYQRFKFPNWAAKFYLDAYLLLYKITSE
ncbi:MAG: hypothetical protein IPJ74_09620 [Saprospiraceae bacterium]|nr:hypothetical protein [Saprospiraceae bacterium]